MSHGVAVSHKVPILDIWVVARINDENLIFTWPATGGVAVSPNVPPTWHSRGSRYRTGNPPFILNVRTLHLGNMLGATGIETASFLSE